MMTDFIEETQARIFILTNAKQTNMVKSTRGSRTSMMSYDLSSLDDRKKEGKRERERESEEEESENCHCFFHSF